MNWWLKLSLSALGRHWLQSLLLLLGLALGTAVVVAVDLANQSASRSFAIAQEAFSGKTTHRIIASSGGSVPESVYLRLRREGLQAVAPLLTGRVQVRQWQNRPLRLLGIDPLAEAPFRSYLGVGTNVDTSKKGDPGQNALPDFSALAELIGRNDTVMLPAALAKEMPADRRLNLSVAGHRERVEAVGLLQPGDSLLAASLGDVLLCDIGTAQRVLNRPGALSEIDLILSPPAEATLARIKALLPPGLILISARSQSDALAQMSRAFSLNLSALSLLALIVGMFLVYNTVSFSVLRRRGQLGTLRTLGVTRAQIYGLILGETLILGLLGSGLGVGLGIALGQGLLGLVVRTINDLYYTLEVTRLTIAPLSLLKGVGGALLAALLATLLPAWEATCTPPAGVLRASTLEERLQPKLVPLAGIGLLLILAGGASALLPLSLWFSFVCFVLVVAGAALCIPWLAHASMDWLAGRLDPVLRLAPRNLARSLSRSAVAMAALMVAVSVVISVSIMIGSFRQTLVDWLDLTLSADLFVIQAEGQGLPDALRTQIAREPGVAGVESARQLELTGSEGITHLLSLSRDVTAQRRYVWLEGSRQGLWQRLEAGGVLVSQPYATRHGLGSRPGQSLTLATDAGPRRFQVLGIYYDYASDQGIVMLPQSLFRRYWHDRLLTSLSVFLAPGQDVQKLKQSLNARLAGPYQLDIQARGDIKRGALTIFERTFAITGALRLLAIIVAVMGIFSTLMSLLIERRRSFGILRALGLTPSQLGGLILFESGLMGLFAGLLALPLGVILALFLIYVINLRSFGWSMDLRLEPATFAQGLLLALAAAMLGGLWPAWKAMREQVAKSIRWE
ncbi:MAG: ABC transporter permease [Candidatus Sericytochromatia bacterium]